MKPTGSRGVFAIQLVASPDDNAATLQLIETLKLEPVRQEYEILNYFNVVVRLDQSSLAAIAARPEVVSIAPYPNPKNLTNGRIKSWPET